MRRDDDDWGGAEGSNTGKGVQRGVEGVKEGEAGRGLSMVSSEAMRVDMMSAVAGDAVRYRYGCVCVWD